MAATELEDTVKLDDDIKLKLKKAFKVDMAQIDATIDFFNKTLKPAIKSRYLSHLVSSVEDMINETAKKLFLQKIKEKNLGLLKELIEQKRFRLFSITLVELPQTKGRKAKSIPMKGGVFIYYAKYLQDNEKRFVIAHELGHIVNNYLLNLSLSDTQQEYAASLFAYIALIDKNNFYKNECKNYISNTELELFNEYKKLLHKTL